MSTRCRFSRRVLNFHARSCPSVLLKYAPAALSPGGTYQLPQRSLATSGLRGAPPGRASPAPSPSRGPGGASAAAARATNCASAWMLARRLWMLSVERLSVASSVDSEGCEGKMRSVWRGWLLGGGGEDVMVSWCV